MNEPKSHTRFDSILQLPRRAVPEADEDLLSIIRRTASRMGYEDLRWILRPQGKQWGIKEIDIPLLSSYEAFHMLQRLLLLSEEQLYKHTPHRFAPYLENIPQTISQEALSPEQHTTTSTQQMRLSLTTLKKYFLHNNSIRVCSLCVTEQDSYDRLYWRLKIILYCPFHRILLLEKCPECGTPIIAHRQHTSICHKCRQGDYRTCATTPLASDHPYILGELLFLHMLGITLSDCRGDLLSLRSSPLLTVSNTSYMSLFRHITHTMEHFFTLQELAILAMMYHIIPEGHNTLFHDMLSSKSALAFALFHWLFLEWPTHFTTFLDAWYSITTPPYTGEHPEPVRVFGRYLFSDSATYDGTGWLREAYQSYHTQFHYDSIRIDHLRQEVNQRARSMHVQQNEASVTNQEQEKTSTTEFDTPLFVPPRVLTPIRPYPWESLTSALSRAAIHMNHPCPEQLLYRAPFTPKTDESSSRGEPLLPSEADDPTLAHLLQIPKESLMQLSHSPLIMSLGLPPYDLDHRSFILSEPTLHSWLLPYMIHSTTKVCPQCVQEPGGYDRLYWNLNGVLCCPRHRVHLLKKCPSCLHFIPAMRTRTEQCPLCKNSLNILPTEQLREDDMLITGTSLLLTMLHIPYSEASSAYKHFAPSPLLAVKPSTYFALLIAFTEEIWSYYENSQQLLHLCHLIDDSDVSNPSSNLKTADDPYAFDAEVLLFHTLFSHWPVRFFKFLDILYRTVHLPFRPPGYLHTRWWWLLSKKWHFITPQWLIDTFKEYDQHYREADREAEFL